MKTITETNGFKLSFNNSGTYFITDNNNDCWFATNTERKAMNKLRNILKCYGVTI